MKTRARFIASFSILLWLFSCKAGQPERLEVRLDRWVILGEDLRIVFTMPMAEAGRLAVTPLPEITIDPPLRGAFSWASPTEIVFTPEKDEIKIGVSYSVSIGNAYPLKGRELGFEARTVGEFMGRYFQMAGKAADWPVNKGNPGLVDFVGWHTGEIGQGGLLLLYDQPVTPEKLTGLVKAETTYDNHPLKIALSTPSPGDISFNDELESDHLVAVKIANLPESGTGITVKAPSWKEEGVVAHREWNFTVNRHFTWELDDSSEWRFVRGVPEELYEAEEGGGGERFPHAFVRNWNLRFNNPVSLEEVQSALTVDSPDGGRVDFSVSGWNYDAFNVSVKASPGRKIRLTLGDMTDSLGNPLEKKLNVTVSSPDLPPELFLPRSPLVVERKGNTLPVKFMNISKLKVNYRSIGSPVDYIRMLNKSLDNVVLRNVRTKSFPLGKDRYPMNEYHRIDIPLETVSSFQLVSITAEESGSQAGAFREHTILVHSSDVAVTSKVARDGVFVWVTSIAKPATLKGAAVTLHDASGETLAKAVTDASGTAFLTSPDLLSGEALERSLYVSAVASQGTGFSRLVETELASAWQFRLPGTTGEERLGAVIFSDRGVYRSGDTVHLKVIVDRGASEAADVTVVVHDARGREAYNATLPLDSFASAAFDFAVKPNAPVGEYTVYARRGNSRSAYAFRVEEYRAPNFVVNVSGQREEWRNGERNYGRIKAEYAKGGVLAGRPVSWRVYRQRVPFSTAKLPGYVFGLASSDEIDGNVADGEGTLNEAGELTLDFSIAEPVTDSLMLYVLQGTVTDLDRQVYSGAFSAVVHPAAWYAGVKPPARDVVAADDDIVVPVVVVDRKGNPVSGVKVAVSLEEVEYHTNVRLVNFNLTRMDTREEYAGVQSATVDSQKAPVQCRLNVPHAGRYRVVCEITDNERRTMRTGFPLTVTGDRPASWPRFDKEQIELVTDRDRYREGDTASLVTMSPYRNALGLLTLEKDGAIVYKKTFTIDNNTPAVRFPVKSEYAPHVFASVIILRGREHFEKDATGFETGAPGFKIGYAKIDVDPASRRLSLSITPAARTVHPGETFAVNLECRDKDRKPATGQVTLAVVDEAVLSLTGYRLPDPLSRLLSSPPLGVRTGSNLLDLPDSRRSRHETLFEGGGDDLSGYLEPAKVLRNLFMSTAYWNPSILLDSNGRATVQVKLPDNITGYRIMGIVTDIRQRMGSATERITSKKPLMIMPVLPRFVYEGDRLTVEARVFNETGAAGTTAVTAALKGLRNDSGALEQKKAIGSFSQEFFRFPVTVTAKDTIGIRFSAALGSSTDAAEYSVPVLNPATDRKTVRGAIAYPGGTIPLDCDLPEGYVAGTLRFELSAASTALPQLADAVTYVMQYPHGCIEQTTSGAYPLIIFRDLLKEIGVSVDQAQLEDFTEAGIKRITTFLTPSGGLSYWPGEEQPHAYGTGFGAMALVEARAQGYAVPPEVISRLGDYMERTLGRTPVTNEIDSYGDVEGDTLALYAAVLGRMGRPMSGYARMLWTNGDRLSVFGLSFLAVAIRESGGDRELLAKVLQALTSRIKEYPDEAYIAERGGGGYSLGSNVRSQGAALYALSAAGSDDALAYKLLSGLLKRRRKGGFWGGTQETIFAVMGIHRFSIGSSAGTAPEIEITVNGKKYGTAALETVTARVSRLNLGEDEFGTAGRTITCQLRNKGSRPVFASARLAWREKLDQSTMAPVANGFTVERSWETAGGAALDPAAIPLGALVLVRLKVKADARANYCAIDDRLPAGFEPLNANLRTTERVGTGRMSDAAQKTLDLISYSEIRDSRVFFYANELPAGEYEFDYWVRATIAGTFLAPACRVEPMYDPDRFGTTRIDIVTVKK